MLEKIKKTTSDFKKGVKKKYRAIIENKKALDFIAAGLTIPVMLTLIINNYYNIQNKKKQEESKKETNEKPIEIKVNISPGEKENGEALLTPTESGQTPVPTKPGPTKASCKLDPAPVKIVFPGQDEVVFDDPVCVVLKIEQEGYCPSEWAYRVNNAGWSDYSDSQICLYNMKEGKIKLDIRIRNVESERVKTYTRNFIYRTEEGLMLTPTLIPTPTE